MKESYLDQILEIEKSAYGSHHWSKDSFTMEIGNQLGNYFCAFDKKTNKLVGYCGFWIVFDEGHITTIAVHPDYKKKKIGERLLRHIIDTGYEKNAKWFTLEVRASNITAQNLYYKYDFKSIGVRRGYYQDNGEDALIMWTENIWSSGFKNKFKELKKTLKIS